MTTTDKMFITVDNYLHTLLVDPCYNLGEVEITISGHPAFSEFLLVLVTHIYCNRPETNSTKNPCTSCSLNSISEKTLIKFSYKIYLKEIKVKAQYSKMYMHCSEKAIRFVLS